MSTNSATARYPKRQRKAVNYQLNVDPDFDTDADEAELNEGLGENVTTPPDDATAAANGESDPDDDDDDESDAEDATYGSRKTKSKKTRMTKRFKKSKAKTKVKRLPKFKPFRLMDLPTELRLKVYQEALVDPHGVYIRTYDDKYEKVAVHVTPRFIDRATYQDRKGYVKGVWQEFKLGDLPMKKYQLSPNLLATCKTVHAEAISLLWKQPFIFADVHGLLSLLLPLRRTTISLLEDVTILKYGWVVGRNTPAFVLLRDAVNLRNLRFDCHIRNAREYRNGSLTPEVLGERLADRLYKDCHPFIKAFISHRGVDALVKVLKFDKGEFKHHYYNHASHTYTTEDWTKEKEAKAMESMAKQITTITTRKTSPKFSRA